MERDPQYIDEVELLLGTPFFYDDERQDSLLQDPHSLDPAVLGMRSLNLYRWLTRNGHRSQ